MAKAGRTDDGTPLSDDSRLVTATWVKEGKAGELDCSVSRGVRHFAVPGTRETACRAEADRFRKAKLTTLINYLKRHIPEITSG